MRGNHKWYQTRTRRGLAQRPKAGRQAGTTTRSDHGYSMSGGAAESAPQSTSHHQRRRSSRSHVGKTTSWGNSRNGARDWEAGRGSDNGDSDHSTHCRSSQEETSRSRTILPLLRTRMVLQYPTPILAAAVTHESRSIARIARLANDRMCFTRAVAGAPTPAPPTRLGSTTTPAAAAILSQHHLFGTRPTDRYVRHTYSPLRAPYGRASLRPAGRKTVLASSDDGGGGTSGNAPGRSYRARYALS